MPQTKTGVDFTPDGDFEKSVNAGPTKKHIDDLPPAKEGFIAEYQQLRDEGKELKVGHAGLYWEEDGTAHLTEKTGKDELVETTIDLGLSGKGKLLVLCEEGIANMVRELADDDGNHLPSSKTGVVVYYVIQGIARDFGITFNRQPVSLGGNYGRGASQSGRDAGKRALTKKEKNALLDRMNIAFYQQDIQDGKMTFEEAQQKTADAFKQKLELEKLGYYLSPNKTEGVMMYDWKSCIKKAYETAAVKSKDVVSVYTKNKLEVLIPNVYDNYFADKQLRNKTNANHIVKSKLAAWIIEDAIKYSVGGMKADSRQQVEQETFIESLEDILKEVGFNEKGEVMGVHIAKMKHPGMMKPRWIVVDTLVDGRQVLHCYDKEGGKSTFHSV